MGSARYTGVTAAAILQRFSHFVTPEKVAS